MAKVKQNNTVIWVLLGILLVCFGLLGFGFYKYFYAGSGNNKYGDRLDGIDKYPLSTTLEQDIKDVFKDSDAVNKVSIDKQGKIVYIIIDYKKPLLKKEAQDLAIKSLEPIGEDNLTFYDIQFILTYSTEENTEESNFPMFGAKSSNSNKVVW